MSLVVVKRPPRRPAPPLPAGEILLEAPPELPDAAGKSWARLLSMLPMAAGTAAMGLMMSQGRGGPITYVAGGMYGVSTLGMMATMVAGNSGPGKREMIEARRQYMRRLSTQRAQVRDVVRRQREAVHYRHPDPGALWSTVNSGRLWERRRGDGDFGVARLGLGPQELATPLIPPRTRPVDELEPLCAKALRTFVASYSVVAELPVAVALRDFSHVYLRGPQDGCRGLVRAVLAQLAAFHSPDDLLVAVCVSDEHRADWEWAKWLPHALHATKSDAVGQVRLFTPSVTALEAMLDDVLAGRGRFTPAGSPAAGRGAVPHVVVVVDGGRTEGSDHVLADGGVEGVTLLDLSGVPPRLLDGTSVILNQDLDGRLRATTAEGGTDLGRADSLGVGAAEVLARQLAPLRLSASSVADRPALGADLGLGQLLGLADPYGFDLAALRAGRPTRDRLRVPIGVGPDGRPLELDLKESAQDGMGPHGLLIGATGSGKSELLRTLVLALAVTHSPEILNFVLVDFKGGATFAALDRLPHTSAVITNLADELSLVDRMLGAISGELVRRQELLRDAGNHASQRDYERARAAGVPLEPLPSLLIICDEFSELLTARPDFIDMFVQIGRVGRSLGVHLLLASQRLEEGRLRGLETHLSYRLGLRTFSSMESRAVLGVPDAYELPRAPGHGFLKVGTDTLTRFKAAYVSGVQHSGGGPDDSELGQAPELVRPYGTHYVLAAEDRRALEAPEASAAEQAAEQATEQGGQEAVRGDTLMDILVKRLEGQGPAAHQVWLPPLAEPPTLDRMLPPVAVSGRGLTVEDPAAQGALRAVTGLVDRPFEQRREVMTLDLAGAAGNVLLAGAQQSGKSTFIRSLITSLALAHTPRELQVYCLDFGGGALRALAGLPHVGGVGARREGDAVRRTVAEVRGILQQREARFAEHGVDGMAAYRRARRSGRFADDPFGDVFLVVDGWSTLRSEFEDLEPLVVELAARGLGLGVHVVAACGRWTDIRPQHRDLFGTKVELRLGEPGDSVLNRRAAVNVPELSPGHGLTPEGLHFLTALPRLDGRQDPESIAEGLTELVARVRDAWDGDPAPAVRLLPDVLPYEALPLPGPGPGPVSQGPVTSAVPVRRGRLPIGIAEIDLQPVHVDFDADPHLLLFGDIECGKSSFLRGLARGITRSHTPAQARVILVDQRRSLLGCIDTEHLAGYGSSAQVTAELVAGVVTVLRERLPGPDVTAEQLRTRSWWKGAEVYVLVDDYDLVAGAATNPLAPLVEFLAQGRDLGLHLILTRRIGGASRAMFDPVIARIRELAAPGIMMSGPREEGALFGNLKPQPLPPGRGWLITRRDGARLVQLAWCPPAQ
ncbi:type VII secretion protein EccCa [Catenulispora sp. GAS73]|uniref:type VII secretion protein EccCa n=1 Tax=Catenulispora sp. GAS73 TaxID=3156269 RepID=UPI00351476B1